MREATAQAVAPEGRQLARRRRPGRALLSALHGLHALIGEALHALTLVGFRGENVALRVHGDAVHAEELARLASPISEGGDDLEALPIHDVDPLVLAVGQVDEGLLRIWGEGDIPHRAIAEGLRRDELLLHE